MEGQWYKKRWLAVSLHILFWALIFAFPYLLRPVFENNNNVRSHHFDFHGFYYLNFIDNLVKVALFYANAFLFIPQLLYRKKYAAYVVVLLLSIGVMLVVDRLAFQLFFNGADYKLLNFFFFNIPFFVFVIVSSAAFRMIQDRVKERQSGQERETENLKTELSFLRSQVSPHFMFNIMNNMVSLARKKSELLEPSLIKLSALLRYMLYETHEKVPLQKEIEYLESYIDLQRQRFSSKMMIRSDLPAGDNGYQIEPMLLIPFVENAFKHGTGLIENPEIDVQLKLEQKLLSFTVRNRFSQSAGETRDNISGIGLANVQRRLALLYRNKHSLLITKQDNWFIASLQIVLD